MELKRFPDQPRFQNAAGRLLQLLEFLPEGSYLEAATTLFSSNNTRVNKSSKPRAFTALTSILHEAYDEFLTALNRSTSIPNETKEMIADGLSDLGKYVFLTNATAAVNKLTPAENKLLAVAASLLGNEPMIDESDVERIQESTENLRREIDNASLEEDVRISLLEIVRLSKGAIDCYSIYGAKGFQKALKKMIGELVDVNRKLLDENNRTLIEKVKVHVRLMDEIACAITKYLPLVDRVAAILG